MEEEEPVVKKAPAVKKGKGKNVKQKKVEEVEVEQKGKKADSEEDSIP